MASVYTYMYLWAGTHTYNNNTLVFKNKQKGSSVLELISTVAWLPVLMKSAESPECEAFIQKQTTG